MANCFDKTVGILRTVGTWRAMSLLVLMLLAGCSGTTESGGQDFMATGTITGPDMRRCVHPCCGGWFIEIEGKRYRFFELPEGSGINLNSEHLPIDVELNWTAFEGALKECAGDAITITAIEKL